MKLAATINMDHIAKYLAGIKERWRVPVTRLKDSQAAIIELRKQQGINTVFTSYLYSCPLLMLILPLGICTALKQAALPTEATPPTRAVRKYLRTGSPLISSKREESEALKAVWVDIGKFQGCSCCNCLSESGWEGKPRRHFRKPVASAATTLWTWTVFTTVGLFSCLFVCFFFLVSCFCDGWQNQAPCLHPVLREAR
jgi:hypothetical protein